MDKTFSKITLVGGQSHGLEMDVDDSLNSIDVPVYSDIEDRVSQFSDTYLRRELKDDAAGDNWIYFGHSADDETETEALARYLRAALTGEPIESDR